MKERIAIKWFYGISILFIILCTIFIANEFYWITLAPAAILIVLLVFFDIEALVLLSVFFTPLSINMKDIGGGVGISLPTEPVFFGIMLLFILQLFYSGGFDKKIVSYPVTIAILVNLIWMGITSISSELPVVSIKFILSRLWFVTVFFFLATQLFKNYGNIKRFVWLYAVPLMGVVIYTIINHMQYDFARKPADWVMSPFYNDHTAYAAVIALFLPIIASFSQNKQYGRGIRVTAFTFSIVFIIALLLSYSRAAWLSVAITFIIYLFFLLRIRIYVVLLIAGLAGSFLYIYGEDIMLKVEENRQDSSADYTSHLKSISNVSTDASNVERINRWKCALRMFNEKPILGWGPGTYAFLYAPFQRSSELTIISTNAGDRGTTHSEYLEPLAESGILGMLSFIFIVVTVLYKGGMLFISTTDTEHRLIIMGVLLGLVTYFIHGSMNNFLDSDKASVPFWGFIAIITAMDVYHRKN